MEKTDENFMREVESHLNILQENGAVFYFPEALDMANF